MFKFALLDEHTNQNRYNSLLIALTLQCFSIPSITNRINNKGIRSWVSNVVSVCTIQTTVGVVEPLKASTMLANNEERSRHGLAVIPQGNDEQGRPSLAKCIKYHWRQQAAAP